MEIIDLKNFSSSILPTSSDSTTPSLQVTDIKPAVKNPNRVNIFIDNKYSFSLDLAQVIDFKLKVGTPLTQDDLTKYQHASTFGKLYQRTLEWVLTRPRSIKETKDYLRKKIAEQKTDLTDTDQNLIIDRLRTKNYLNDQKFAEHYVENRFLKKGISARRLRQELTKKGIDKDTIDQTLHSTTRTDATEIQKLIAKKRTSYDDQKLIQYLIRQGFDYDLAKTAVRETDLQNSE